MSFIIIIIITLGRHDDAVLSGQDNQRVIINATTTAETLQPLTDRTIFFWLLMIAASVLHILSYLVNVTRD